jgi:hypothetical protein
MRQKLTRATSVSTVNINSGNLYFWAHLIGWAVQGVGLRPLPCWDSGFTRGMNVSHMWGVLSGSGLCVGLVACPEEWYLCACDREASVLKRHLPTRGSSAMGESVCFVATASKKVRGRSVNPSKCSERLKRWLRALLKRREFNFFNYLKTLGLFRPFPRLAKDMRATSIACII